MGGNSVAVFAVVLLLVLGLLSFRIDGLPRRLLGVMKQERAREDGQAQSALLEAAGQKVHPLVSGMKSVHDQMVASLRAQIAEAEARARAAERQAQDLSVYLDAASTLVAELRTLRDALRAPAEAPGRSARIEPRRPTVEESDGGDADQRATVELPRVPSPRAPAVSSEPAMVAARLVPRSAPRTAPSDAPAARSGSRLGDARREPEGTPDWMVSERPSDPEGERTKVGPRPPARALGLGGPPIKPTLLSMGAVAPPAKGQRG
ncbi:MAG: hypothetical protein U0359_18140 [Byssovorax sp.]